MTNNKFFSTLGLARRAGKLCYGFDAVTQNLQNIELILVASDLSARSKKSLAAVLEHRKKSFVALGITMKDLADAIGTKPTGIIGITEKGFAALLSEEIKKMNAGGTQL